MRRRGKRKPRALMNPITLAIEGAAISRQADLNRLRTFELASIEQFAKGQADEKAWYDLNAMLDICEAMAEGGIGPEALEACQRGRAALAEDMARYRSTGKMGTTGQGLQAYRDVFAFHDLQRQSIARSEYERYVQKAINRVKSQKAGSPDQSHAR